MTWTLEATLHGWVRLIEDIIARDKRREHTKGEGPMSEINDWRDRNAALSTVYV